MTHTRIARSILSLLSSLLLCTAAGCNVLGFGAAALPPPTIMPQHKLAGQSVGVMVWADRGIRIDWSPIQIDLANAIQGKLQQAQGKGKVKELKSATFPVSPASIVRHQQNHPEIEDEPITQVAPELGVSRLIYVEIEDFATRGEGGADLFRGFAQASIKVVEVKDGLARVAFEESDIIATFPRKVPREGIPHGTDYRIYVGTVDELSSEIVKRFIPHSSEER